MDELAPISENDRMIAALTHASAVLGFGGWAPILIFLVFKDRSPFVRFHALQATVFQLGFTVAVISIALCTFGLGAILILPWMLLELWLAWEAWQGNWTGYPGMGGMFRD